MDAITSGFDGRVIIDDDINGSTPQRGFALMVYTPVEANTNTGPDGAGLRVGDFHGGSTSTVTATANGHDIYGAVIDYHLITTGKTGVEAAMLGVLGQLNASGTDPELYAILESVNNAGINAFKSDTLIGGEAPNGGPYGTYPGPLSGRLHVWQEATDGAKAAIFARQDDTDEDLLSLEGSSITTVADATLVEEAEVASHGALIGWFKIHVKDNRGGGIAEADLYAKLFAAPTMT